MDGPQYKSTSSGQEMVKDKGNGAAVTESQDSDTAERLSNNGGVNQVILTEALPQGQPETIQPQRSFQKPCLGAGHRLICQGGVEQGAGAVQWVGGWRGLAQETFSPHPPLLSLHLQTIQETF